MAHDDMLTLTHAYMHMFMHMFMLLHSGTKITDAHHLPDYPRTRHVEGKLEAAVYWDAEQGTNVSSAHM